MTGPLLVRWFVGADADVSDPEVRKRIGLLEGWASVVVNVAVFVVKLVPGILIGSISLIADAVHSLADVVTSGVVIWSFTASARPPDREHPFGHGRVEHLASLVIALLLLVASFEFVVVSVRSMLSPRVLHLSPWVLVMLGATILLKEWLARFALTLGRRIASPALVADAWHHRSDVLATGVVFVALAGERFGVHRLDGVAGLIVAGFIARTAYKLIRESVDPLIGGSPDSELVRTIREIALSVPGVEGIHDLMVHSYGHLLVISLHAEVPARLTLGEAHDVLEEIERRLADRLGAVAVVHVDPVDRTHPLYPEMEAVLQRAVEEIDGLEEFHDLRIVCGPDSCGLVVEVVVEGQDPETVAAQVEHRIREAFPAAGEVVVTPDRVLVY